MKSEDWVQVETIFHVALDLPRAERDCYLESACVYDDRLRKEVESLIEEFESGSEFMAEPALELGMMVLGDEPAESLTGQKIGIYSIGQKLGGGGMGDVYLAEDTRLKRPVALKFLTTSFLDDNWAKRHLEREAQAVARLDHRNICQVYGFEEIGEHRFIVMQYVKGQTLSRLIRNKELQPEEVLPMARQIVDAIAAAHEHGIIHRDIKPGNIMLTTEGQVKVLDFGLAKIIHDQNRPDEKDENLSHLSRDGLILGTVAYMSPEQLMAEKLDYRSDIFSLGTVLFELATGKHPFERKSDAETISTILALDSPVDAFSTPNMHISLRRVVKKCLEKEKERRYQSASELLLDLQNQIEVPATKRRGFGWRFLIILFLSLLLGIAGLVYLQTARVYSVAVLPFSNDSTDPNLDYVTDGIAESLTGKLSEDGGFRIIPYTKLSGYRGIDDIDRVGREVKSDLVVSGKITRQAEGLVVSATLVDTRDGSVVRITQNPFSADDLPSVETTIIEKLFAGLEIRKNSLLKGKSRSVGDTDNPEAFRQYMIGRYLWKKRDEVNIKKAIAAFEQAIELDPLYARAHAGLADSYVVMNLVTYGKIRTKETMARARAAAKHAIELDPENAEAYTSLGVISTRYDWNWQEAERELRRAIEINSDYAPAHYWLADLLAVTGRSAESIAEAEKARELDPFSPLVDYNFARTLYYGRQFDQALEFLTNSGSASETKIRYLLGLTYLQKGMSNEALVVFQEIFHKNKMLGIAALGHTYGKLNMRTEAMKLIAFLEEQPKNESSLSQEIAIIYIGLNENDKAFYYLRDVVADRHGAVVALKVEPLFDPLRNDPRFDHLLAQMSLN